MLPYIRLYCIGLSLFSRKYHSTNATGARFTQPLNPSYSLGLFEIFSKLLETASDPGRHRRISVAVRHSSGQSQWDLDSKERLEALNYCKQNIPDYMTPL